MRIYQVVRCEVIRETRFNDTFYYNLLNSSNKRACSNTFVNVTLVKVVHIIMDKNYKRMLKVIQGNY